MEFEVKVRECNRELSPKQRIAIKDITDCIPIGNLKEDEQIVINPDIYAVLDIHNEKAENKDYTVYVIIDKDGTKYSTSSDSFWNAFKGIATEMEQFPDEEYSVKVYSKPSNNYKGKFFITCSII